ncbi:MAG: short-chain dehydrogenase [Omnitrophica bacterium RIFCSPHIGHO2_02_FULL_46_11]|nr:MAG: short-chain dehydrogenase [Omnitrophica bacterium RIFCSPHIGHO2_02_FULL_46_11]
MKSLWRDAEARRKNALDQLVYRSRLIGYEAKLCVWGGGNTSTKRIERDHLGRSIKILWVKGSGSDLKVSERKHFSPLRLDDLSLLLRREQMTDEEMVELLSRSLMDPKAPRPSIEALLHAFLPFQDIDHSHADAILSVTNTKHGREIAKKIYGSSLIWIPYVKPGFTLAKRMYEAYRKNPKAQGAILENHGLITWGDSSKESYSRMIQMVSRAESYIHKKARGRSATKRSGSATRFGGKPFGPSIHKTLNESARKEWLRGFLPIIRKVVSARKEVVLHVVTNPAVLEFVNSKLGPRLSQIGPATPDHMLRTKRIPLFVKINPRHCEEAVRPTKQSQGTGLLRFARNDGLTVTLEKQIESFAKAHERYFHRFRKSGMQMLDPYPRVLLIPGIGLIATGKDKDSAIQCAEVYEHSIQTMRGAQAIDQYRSLSLPLAFEMEYWSLELYKLTLAPPEKPLARKIALITGACGAIGRAISEKLVREGAHIAICDLDLKKAEKLASELDTKFGIGRAMGLKMDVTKEKDVVESFSKTVLEFGGLDAVVSNAGIAHISPVDTLALKDWEKSLGVNATGHFLVAREAIKILKKQSLGGNLIFIATKNVLAPGKDFGAYSASKSAEAQLARICAIEGGEWEIRSNMVNPDGVFEGSGLWSQEIRKERANSYGIKTNQLEAFYQNRNLLKTQILPSDVANSVAFLASDESSKTTGCILTVDGGVREAFPR